MITKEEIFRRIYQLNSKVLGLEDKIEKVYFLGEASGESNNVYFVNINDLPYLIKVNAVSDKDKGFFRREFDKLRALKNYSISPKAYFFDDTSFDIPFMILERYEGRNLQLNEVKLHLPEIVYILNQLVTVPHVDIRRKKGFKRKIKTCREYVQLFPDYAQIQLEQYRRRIGKDALYLLVSKAHSNSRRFIETYNDTFNHSELGLIHTGMHPKNLIFSPDGRLRLIDWEHAGIGDRAFEVSSLFRSNLLNEQDKTKLLEEYKGKTGLFYLRVALYDELFKVHEVLWHAIRINKLRNKEIRLVEGKDERHYKMLLEDHIHRLEKSCLSL